MKQNTFSKDTICALATAIGGAIATIRISGEHTLEILNGIFSKDISTAHPNTTHYGIIGKEQIIDEVVVSIYKAPHSYTGEDSVEISCHGSTYIIQQILNLLTANGCRLARPGEFTQRAFLNGKMDLSQAEAVADLISSTNKATHHIALSQLRGNFSTQLGELRAQLLKLTSLLELELDFSDHEDLEFADRGELLQLTRKIEQHITQLAKSFQTGRALKSGVPVAIVGKTNVGKSTLLNALLKDNRAIVSNIHGTTRDTIEDNITIHGINFRFIDTAGIRTTTDEVEQIGIDRTYDAINKAQIILWVIDQNPTKEESEHISTVTNEKALIIVRNKIDSLTDTTSFPNMPNAQHISISAKVGTNIDDLEELIYQTANIPEVNENDVIITSVRHYEALCRTQESIKKVAEGLEFGISGDLLSEDLRQVLNILAEITGGQITTDEVLSNIFSHFCIGK